jgi:hypothetical protein
VSCWLRRSRFLVANHNCNVSVVARDLTKRRLFFRGHSGCFFDKRGEDVSEPRIRSLDRVVHPDFTNCALAYRMARSFDMRPLKNYLQAISELTRLLGGFRDDNDALPGKLFKPILVTICKLIGYCSGLKTELSKLDVHNLRDLFANLNSDGGRQLGMDFLLYVLEIRRSPAFAWQYRALTFECRAP